MASGTISARPITDSSWTDVYGAYCLARIVNGIVFLRGYSNGTKAIGGSSSSYTALTTLPERFRPAVDWFAPVGWGGSSLGMRIKEDGTIEFTGESASYWNYSTSYPAKTE